MFAEYIAGWNLAAFILLILGLGLLILEMFLPGFGVAGVLGILSLFAAIALRADSFQNGLLTAAIIIIVLIVTAAFVFRSAAGGRLSRTSIILKEQEKAEITQKELPVYIGQTGIAVNRLRPSGNAEFNGFRADVMTLGEFVDKGRTVRIEQIIGSRVIVKVVNAEAGVEVLTV